MVIIRKSGYAVIYVFSLFITFVGGIFVRKPNGEAEPDTSWEHGREVIFSYGINYWNKLLYDLLEGNPDGTFLEVGSGNGQWLIAASKHCEKVIGIEPNKEVREYSLEKVEELAEKKERISVIDAGAEEIPVPDSSVDILFCVGVFMFTNQAQALKEFARVLKPEGKLVVTVNGLGYFIMYVLNGMRFFSVQKTQYGICGIISSFVKWISGKQLSLCAVTHNEIESKLIENDFGLEKTYLWLANNIYPYEHLGFATNYCFTATKK